MSEREESQLSFTPRRHSFIQSLLSSPLQTTHEHTQGCHQEEDRRATWQQQQQQQHRLHLPSLSSAGGFSHGNLRLLPSLQQQQELQQQQQKPRDQHERGQTIYSNDFVPCDNLRKGRWSPSEDDRLRVSISRFGANRWKQVAEQVQTRSGDQCWKRWNDSLDPQLNHSQWTPAEDVILEEAVLRCGRLWSKIASEVLPGRSGLGCKNRWDHIQRKQRRMHQSQRDIRLREPEAHRLTETGLLSFDRHHSSSVPHSHYADLDQDSTYQHDDMGLSRSSSHGSCESGSKDGRETRPWIQGDDLSDERQMIDDEEEVEEQGLGSDVSPFHRSQSVEACHSRFLGPTFTTNWTIAGLPAGVNDPEGITPTREAYGQHRAAPSQSLFSSSLPCSLPLLSEPSHHASHDHVHYASDPAWYVTSSNRDIYGERDRCPPLPILQQHSEIRRSANHPDMNSSSTVEQMRLHGIGGSSAELLYSTMQRNESAVGNKGEKGVPSQDTLPSSHPQSDGFHWSPLKTNANRSISIGMGTNTPFADMADMGSSSSSSISNSNKFAQREARSSITKPGPAQPDDDALRNLRNLGKSRLWEHKARPSEEFLCSLAFADHMRRGEVQYAGNTGYGGCLPERSNWQRSHALGSGEQKSLTADRVKVEDVETMVADSVDTSMAGGHHPVQANPFFQKGREAAAFVIPSSRLPKAESLSNNYFSDDAQYNRQDSSHSRTSISKLLQHGQRLYDDGDEVEEGEYNASQTSDEAESQGGVETGEEDEVQEQEQERKYGQGDVCKEAEEEEGEEQTSRIDQEAEETGYILQLCRQSSPHSDTSALHRSSPFWPLPLPLPPQQPQQHVSANLSHSFFAQADGETRLEQYRRIFSGQDD